MESKFDKALDSSFESFTGDDWQYCWDKYPKSQTARDACMTERKEQRDSEDDEKRDRRKKWLDIGLDFLGDTIRNKRGDDADMDYDRDTMDDDPEEKSYTGLYIGLGVLVAAGIGFVIYKASK